MRIEVTNLGCTLYREQGDKAISHASTVTHHMRRLLRAQGYPVVRFYPDTEGLTGCRQGVINRRAGVCFWHERYAIENAAHEFNCEGKVFYQREVGV